MIQPHFKVWRSRRWTRLHPTRLCAKTTWGVISGVLGACSVKTTYNSLEESFNLTWQVRKKCQSVLGILLRAEYICPRQS